MKLFRASLIALAALIALTGIGHAASYPLSHHLYPAHTQLTYLANADNGTVDYTWGTTDPTTDPGFHTQTEDDLGRTGGWYETGFHKQTGHAIQFAFFVNTYADAAHASDALADFASAAGYLGFTPRPTTVVDGVTCFHAGSVGSNVSARLIGCVQGTTEIEAAAAYQTHSGDGPAAFKDVKAQVALVLSQTTT